MRDAIDASQLLRPGLLEGVSLLLAGAGGAEPGYAQATAHASSALGARVARWQVGTALEPGAVDVLAVDCADVFACARAGDATAEPPSRRALRACLQGAWEATRAVARDAFLPTDGAARTVGGGGRIVYLVPPAADGRAGAGAGEDHAEAARAGLENLARTLSIEWARHGVTAVAIGPGAETEASEVAALTAYLASPAGAYFSGCLLDLSGRRPAGARAHSSPVDSVQP
jgi:NAD(P)-dependent dehydrogenase (short-subunit alcohol dehydrogenase family)